MKVLCWNFFFSLPNLISISFKESDKQPAKQVLQPELHRVRMLNVFEPITVQMGDRNFYKIKVSSYWSELNRERMLNVFEPITVHMGDRNYYKIKVGSYWSDLHSVRMLNVFDQSQFRWETGTSTKSKLVLIGKNYTESACSINLN